MPELTTKLEINEGGVAILTLSRPAVANALNSQMALEIKDIFANLAGDIRAVILTGAGERAFCAGADLKQRAGFSLSEWEEQHQLFREVLHAIMGCPVPVIAAVNGAAYGGGLELALACDFIYAAETARFALPEVTLGIMCGTGGTQTLPRAIGTRRARELLYTGKPFSATEAFALGLVNKISAPENLLRDALEVAKTIATNPASSVAAIKRATTNMNLSLAEGLQLESENYKKLLSQLTRS